MKYAQGTHVPVSQSRVEVENLLKKYKAEGFGYAQEGRRVAIFFKMAGRHIRFMVTLPADRSQDREARLERQMWRCILLSIKAKLESVESGIETIEQAFMAHVVLPGGKTVSQELGTAIESAYKTGKMPPLLGFNP